MPEDFDRRGFIRRASVGAAAVGALAAGGGSLLSASPAAAAPRAERPDEPLLDGTDVVAHIIDARRGEISILVGSREVRLVDRVMTQKLMRATR